MLTKGKTKYSNGSTYAHFKQNRTKIQVCVKLWEQQFRSYYYISVVYERPDDLLSYSGTWYACLTPKSSKCQINAQQDYGWYVCTIVVLEWHIRSGFEWFLIEFKHSNSNNRQIAFFKCILIWIFENCGHTQPFEYSKKFRKHSYIMYV